MAPDETSWAIFMGQVEHGPACPYLELRLTMAQLAPSEKNTQRIINKTVHFFKSLPFFYNIIDRQPKPFDFVSSQVVSA